MWKHSWCHLLRVPWQQTLVPLRKYVTACTLASDMKTKARASHASRILVPPQNLSCSQWRHQRRRQILRGYDGTSTALTRGLCRQRATLLQRLRADPAFVNLDVSRIGQAGSLNRVYCNSYETLERLLMQCLANHVPRRYLFPRLNVFGVCIVNLFTRLKVFWSVYNSHPNTCKGRSFVLWNAHVIDIILNITSFYKRMWAV